MSPWPSGPVSPDRVLRERAKLEAQLGHTIPGGTLTSSQVHALVDALRDITATLAAADPTDKAAVYEEMGIDVTYHPEGRVSVEMLPRGVNVVSEERFEL